MGEGPGGRGRGGGGGGGGGGVRWQLVGREAVATFLFEFAGSSNALSLLIGSGPPSSKSPSEFGG